MKINLFHPPNPLWANLSQHNPTVRQATSGVTFGGEHGPGFVSTWFDPDRYKTLPQVPWAYPQIPAWQHDPQWSLILALPNYLPLFVINLLYRQRRRVLIEDACAGLGRFILYLHKLGFKRFSVIENWSQLPESLFRKTMRVNGIRVRVNEIESHPVVVNHCGYAVYPRRKRDGALYLHLEGQAAVKPDTPIHIDDQTELFFTYRPNFHDMRLQLIDNGFIELCSDSYALNFAFCRPDKHQEFMYKLMPYAYDQH
jgi:hypothetical protein